METFALLVYFSAGVIRPNVIGGIHHVYVLGTD